MESSKNSVRFVGVLFLLIFFTGIAVYQVLQGPVLFSDDFITITSENSNNIIISTLLLFLSGITSIVIGAILFPFFRKYSIISAILYIGFCILNFIAISVDNMSVITMLELSQEYAKNGTENSDALHAVGEIFYKKHWWSHYWSLLISCFSLFVLYFTLFKAKLIPRVISIFGLVAVVLMFIELLFSIFGQSISMNMLLPIGLVQLALPLWLIFKGFNMPILEAKK